MRVQDKVRKMRDLTKGQPEELPIPARTGRVALPPELQDPEKAFEFLKENKERAKPVKA
jgi:NADH-quinone oxidoreductase subunit B